VPPAPPVDVYRLAEHRLLSTSPEPTPQWTIDMYKIRDLWARYNTRGKRARVAVLDTGHNPDHPALKHVAAHDYTGDGPVATHGHGPHCLGIVGAVGTPGGITGVAPECELHSFRVFNNAGVCQVAWINDALRDIMSGRFGKFHVVSMSLGSEAASQEMCDLLQEMSALGHLIVVAAGNDGSHLLSPLRRFGTVGYPAAFFSTIAVGSTDSNRKRSGYSSTGNKLVVTGPGQGITSCWVGDDQYATISGTSMACPFVAGCLALLVSHAASAGLPAPTLESVLHVICASSADLEAPGYDFNTGFGDICPLDLFAKYERFCDRFAAHAALT
jgi:subtilisin family serine protease